MKQERKIREHLAIVLRALRLPTFVVLYAEIADQAARQGWSFEAYLNHLAEAELSDRKRRWIKRHLKRSQLPEGKTLSTMDPSKVPVKVRRQLSTLCEGAFVDHAENVLAFGLPGRGKTHLLCAIAHELVQKLLVAKREVVLEQAHRRLDRYDVVYVDDIGYVQQDREEMAVQFTFLSQRYQRRSVMITSNLVFSQRDRIFNDPMTTAAAIDRGFHHAIILEPSGPSIRNQAAAQRNKGNHETSKRKDGDK